MICSFHEEYEFLSNFYKCRVSHEGICYPSLEHAYQAAKTTDIAKRKEIAALATPGRAKRAGRKLEIRPDWEKIKLSIMYELCQSKFSIPALEKALLETGEELLIEGNNWGDTFWGVSNGKGKNFLGKILMMTREQIRIRHLQHTKFSPEKA